MKLSLLLLSLFAGISCSFAEGSKCNCTKTRGPGGRILGGSDAPSETAYPSVVHLQTHMPSARLMFCGGTILNELWIITAASCAPFEDTEIVAGNPFTKTNAEFEQKRKVAKRINHENYDGIIHENDIALVKLDSPLTFTTPAVQPVKLAPKEFKFTDKYMATVVGWGSVEAGDPNSMSWNLRQVDVAYVDSESCRKALGAVPFIKHDDTDCFGSTEVKKGDLEVWNGPCDGDEGSPLYGTDTGTPPSEMKPQDHRLIGIVSLCNCVWTFYMDGLPSTYTAVRKYIWWLDKTLKANGYEKGIEGSVADGRTSQAFLVFGNASFVLVGVIVSVMLAFQI